MPRRRSERPGLAPALVIILFAVLGVVAGTISHVAAPTNYQSVGLVLTAPGPGDPDRYMADQIAIATSRSVQAAAAETANTSVAALNDASDVKQVRLSNVLRFTVTSSDAKRAQTEADALMNAYMSSPVILAQPSASRGSALVLQAATVGERSGLSLATAALVGLLSGLLLGVVISLIYWRERVADRFAPVTGEGQSAFVGNDR